jgi:hypothetical protein
VDSEADISLTASSGTFSLADDPFSMSLEEFQKDNNVNIYSPFVVAKLAVKDWEALPASAARTFFYTGNVTNVRHLPKFFDMAVGKSGGEKLMWYGAEAYKSKGYKYVAAPSFTLHVPELGNRVSASRRGTEMANHLLPGFTTSTSASRMEALRLRSVEMRTLISFGSWRRLRSKACGTRPLSRAKGTRSSNESRGNASWVESMRSCGRAQKVYLKQCSIGGHQFESFKSGFAVKTRS